MAKNKKRKGFITAFSIILILIFALGGITWACVAASSYIFAFLFAGYIG